MKFYYDMRDRDKKPANDTYWTAGTIRRIRLYPATMALDDEWHNNPDSNLWPVWQWSDFSTAALDCIHKDHAYQELMISLNNCIYEELNDL